jgi:haloacetate dehalogenase
VLDHPDTVLSACFMDIVPTLDMFERVDAEFARTYWHWFFLQLPSPFPERLIEGNPDHFYQASLFALGKMGPEDFDAAQLEAYRRDWRSPDFIRGSCADYRAAAAVDLPLDRQDASAMIEVPSLVLWGEQSTLAQAFDIPAVWKRRLARPRFASLPAGHFFVDQRPYEVAAMLDDFLGTIAAG